MSRTTRSRGYYGWLRDDNEVHYITREYHTQLFYRTCNFAHPGWYKKYVKTDEEFLKDTKEQWARWARDGRDGLTETRRSTGFKTDAKKIVRRANKSFCRAVLSGDDYENIPYATDKLGKDFIYRWW